MSIWHALDFDESNLFRSLLPLTKAERYGTTDSTAGDDASIPYLQAYPEYTEAFTADGGSFQKTMLYVRNDDSSDFRKCALGYTTASTNPDRFNRLMPMASGYSPWLYLQSLTLPNKLGMFKGNEKRRYDTQPFWFRPDWVAFEAVFRPLNDDVLTDDELTSPEPGSLAEAFRNYGCMELARFVVRTPRFIAEERKIGAGGFETYNAATNAALIQIMEPVFVPFRRQEIVYTWRQVPLAAMPKPAIAACSVTVNADPFDVELQYGTTATYQNVYPAGTLLFKSLVSDVKHYVGAGGERYVDLQYLFSFNPYGWNNQPTNDPASTAVFPVRRRNSSGTYPPNYPPYGTSDFKTLFKPRALFT